MCRFIASWLAIVFVAMQHFSSGMHAVCSDAWKWDGLVVTQAIPSTHVVVVATIAALRQPVFSSSEAKANIVCSSNALTADVIRVLAVLLLSGTRRLGKAS